MSAGNLNEDDEKEEDTLILTRTFRDVNCRMELRRAKNEISNRRMNSPLEIELTHKHYPHAVSEVTLLAHIFEYEMHSSREIMQAAKAK